MNRRYFIKSSGIALASFGVMTSAPSFLKRALAEKIAGGRRKTLIAIFQRGAVDGLNVVVPFGEHFYYDLRPNIAVPKPDGGTDAIINLDGFFGLHPALAPFKSLWDSKRLAIVHASGSPDNTRSHFDAQDYMESATPGVKSTGRMAKSLFANERRSAEVPLPRRLHDAEYAARHAGKSANARDF